MGKRPEAWVGSDLRARAEVVQWLTLQGGTVTDDQGLVVGRMRQELRKGRALSQLLADMDNDGMIEREVRGRRTFRIKLVDDWGLLDEVREHQSWQIQTPAPSQPAEVTGEVDLQALAMTLLERVIAQAHAKPGQGAEVERLRDEVTRLKADLREAREANAKVMAEAEEHRRAADTMRENLTKLEASTERQGQPLRAHLSKKDQALLDRLMREVPSVR